MQAYELLQGIQYYFKKYKKEKMYFQNLQVFIKSKVKSLLRADHKNEAYIYKWTFWKR